MLRIFRSSSSEKDFGRSTSPETLRANVAGSHYGMRVMLGGEKLILRRERAVDFADVERAPLGRGGGIEVRRYVGERDDRFALRERREWPSPAASASGRGQYLAFTVSLRVTFSDMIRPPRDSIQAFYL